MMNLENSDNTFLTKGINLEEKLFPKRHLFRMGAYEIDEPSVFKYNICME